MKTFQLENCDRISKYPRYKDAVARVRRLKEPEDGNFFFLFLEYDPEANLNNPNHLAQVVYTFFSTEKEAMDSFNKHLYAYPDDTPGLAGGVHDHRKGTVKHPLLGEITGFFA